MTGRELMLYILANNLEDEPVYKNGKLLGFVTAGEAASKMDVGTATVCAWIHQGLLDCIVIGNSVYIPAGFQSPLSKLKNNV